MIYAYTTDQLIANVGCESCPMPELYTDDNVEDMATAANHAAMNLRYGPIDREAPLYKQMKKLGLFREWVRDSYDLTDEQFTAVVDCAHCKFAGTCAIRKEADHGSESGS